MDLDQVWEEKKELAKNGREFFVDLLKEYNIKEQDGIMVLLESDLEAARYLLQHGNELIQAGKYRRIYILTDSEQMINRIEEIDSGKDMDSEDESWIAKSILCTAAQMDSLVELYQVYKFTNQIIWGTLKNIEDADGYQLEGYHGITKEDIIRTAIMDLEAADEKRIQ